MMSYISKLGLIISLFAIAQGSYTVELEHFIEDTNTTWQLRSPTLVVQGALNMHEA